MYFAHVCYAHNHSVVGLNDPYLMTFYVITTPEGIPVAQTERQTDIYLNDTKNRLICHKNDMYMSIQDY